VLERLIFGAIIVMAMGGARAIGADGPTYKPVKTSAVARHYDWTGLYVGSHFGYATGYSRWSGTEPGMTIPALAGSLDFFKGFDGFKGTGSYSLGLQGGSITCFHRAF
jgi:high affinity Mn2+ porin